MQPTLRRQRLRKQGFLFFPHGTRAPHVPRPTNVRHATYVPARHYGLVDRGALAPGYRADVVFVEDLKDFRVRTVIKNGRVASRDGKCVDFGPAPRFHYENSVHLPPLDERTFHLPRLDMRRARWDGGERAEGHTKQLPPSDDPACDP